MWIVLSSLLLVVLGFAGLGWISRRARPENLETGTIRVCGDSPKCVCSLDARPAFHIEPIAIGGDDGLSRMAEVLAEIPGASPITVGVDYLHFEFKSRLFGFVDDVECGWSSDRSAIEIRSASRVGSSDLGANRKRVEAIRTAYEQACQRPERGRK